MYWYLFKSSKSDNFQLGLVKFDTISLPIRPIIKIKTPRRPYLKSYEVYCSIFISSWEFFLSGLKFFNNNSNSPFLENLPTQSTSILPSPSITVLPPKTTGEYCTLGFQDLTLFAMVYLLFLMLACLSRWFTHALRVDLEATMVP